MDDHELEATLTTVQTWADALRDVEQRLAPCFARREARQRALAYVRGLLSPVERKNSWQLAEQMGDPTPYGFQHLLGRADWNPDQVRDALQTYIVEHLGDPEAVIVVDETGFLRKGMMSAGVARQYSGTAGRIENCQIGVFLSYGGQTGHTLLDRELYLPKAWTEDRPRCRHVGIPDDRALMTKPKLAKRMLERAFAAHIPARWVTGDSIYGDDRTLRIWLEERDQAYVFAVSGKEYVWIGCEHHRIGDILHDLPGDGWQQLSAGDGAKGPRLYEWLWHPLGSIMQEHGRRWLLVRRSLSDPTAVTAYVAFAPLNTTLATLVRVAGTRWAVEDDFGSTKGEVGLDQYEVRSWTGWYRHMTLAMWAHAFLRVVRAAAVTAELPKKGRQEPPNSLATFKRQRGLSYSGVELRFGGCSGAWGGRYSTPSGMCCGGRAGGATTKPVPNFATINAVEHHLPIYNCSIKRTSIRSGLVIRLCSHWKTARFMILNPHSCHQRMAYNVQHSCVGGRFVITYHTTG